MIIIKKNLLRFFFLLIIFGALGYGLYFTITKSDFESQPTLIISVIAFALSGITFIVSIIFPLLTQPILNVIIEQPPVFSNSSDTAHPSSWFHRIFLYNHGLKPAEKCIGKLIEIRISDKQKLTKFDSLPFYWSHQNKHTPFNEVTIFGRGDYAILDVLQEFEVNSAKAKNWYILGEQYLFQEDELDQLINELPILRVHLPNPETLTYHGPNSASPGDKPVLRPGEYFLKIGFYSDNGYSKPEWYKLSITLTAMQTIHDNDELVSKTVFRKATMREKRMLI